MQFVRVGFLFLSLLKMSKVYVLNRCSGGYDGPYAAYSSKMEAYTEAFEHNLEWLNEKEQKLFEAPNGKFSKLNIKMKHQMTLDLVDSSIDKHYILDVYTLDVVKRKRQKTIE